MQPVLQGYLGLLQGENFALKTIENLQLMAISMASWIIIIKQKKRKQFDFIRFFTFSHLELNIILKKVNFRDFWSKQFDLCIKQKLN